MEYIYEVTGQPAAGEAVTKAVIAAPVASANPSATRSGIEVAIQKFLTAVPGAEITQIVRGSVVDIP